MTDPAHVLVHVALPGFLLGVANAAHCAAMCGVFALRASARRPLSGTALYLGGKTFTYVFLGAVAGSVGGRMLGSFAGARTALGVLVGAVLLLAAWRVWRPPAISATSKGPRARLAALLMPLYRAAHGVEKRGGPLALGAATGFLPCGVTYVATLQAGALGTPLDGALSMAAFGAGTAPVLAATGLFGRGIMARLGPLCVRHAGAALLLIAGCVAVGRALLPLANGGAPACCH